MLSGKTLLVTPSLTCAFAANLPPYIISFPMTSFHLTLQLSWWSNGDLFRRSWVRTPPGSEIFSLSPCEPISFLGLLLSRYYSGYLFEHFNLPHLNHSICLIALSGKTLLVTPSLTCAFAANLPSYVISFPMTSSYLAL